MPWSSNLKEIYAARGLAAPPNVEGQALQALIFQQLILNKATEADKAKGREQFNASLQKLKADQHLTDEAFNQTLEKQLMLRGQTRSQWEKQNIEQATIPLVLERELNISVTDAEAKEYYTNHPADFEQPEKVRLCDILLLTVDPGTGTPLPADQQQAKRKKMDELLKRARSGENFTNLAAQYSEDPASKDNNGELPPALTGPNESGAGGGGVFADQQPGQRCHRNVLRLLYHQAAGQNSGQKTGLRDCGRRSERRVEAAENRPARRRLIWRN